MVLRVSHSIYRNNRQTECFGINFRNIDLSIELKRVRIKELLCYKFSEVFLLILSKNTTVAEKPIYKQSFVT